MFPIKIMLRITNVKLFIDILSILFKCNYQALKMVHMVLASTKTKITVMSLCSEVLNNSYI